jgi:hypothetical protein
MAQEAVCRIWYGKSLGIPQSFRDIGNFYGAASFATLMVADRIEVIRRPRTRPVTMERTIAIEQPPPSASRLN